MDGKMIRKNKRSQTTIFVIAAVLIVAMVILFFVLRGKTGIGIVRPSMPEPQSYIDNCVKDASQEAIAIMLPQGGYINPENYKLYKNNKVAYLCYTNNFYYPCINQQPMYIKFLENEIHNYTESKIKDCFFSLKQAYEKSNYIVDEGNLSFEVKLKPKQVEIKINKRFDIKKGEEARRFEKFNSRFNEPLYDLAVIAQEIASQEAKFCYFEYVGYSLFYPSVTIAKDKVGDEETSSKIYLIKNKLSSKELIIAIRSCAMPGGL